MKYSIRHDDTAESASPAGNPFRRIHAHVPLTSLRKKFHLFADHGVHPEIYLSHRALETTSETEMESLAGLVAEHGLHTTIHGPFYDLSPGAIDPAFRNLTVTRMCDALTKAGLFSPDCVVFHPGYDPLRFAEHREAWLRNSLHTWKDLLSGAGTLGPPWILIENIFENEPSTIADLLSRLPSPPFGFCLDIGHFQVFSTVTLDEWFDALGGRLREVHLHDNRGDGDHHLPPGRGSFDFPALFRRLNSLGRKVIGTIEAHSEADLLESIKYLDKRGFLQR